MIEYSLSEYQHGSLVARFDSEPKEADARQHLAAYGIAPDTATSISIQLLGTPAASNSSLTSVVRSTPETSRSRYKEILLDEDVWKWATKVLPPVLLLLFLIVTDLAGLIF
ncbi:hypothetical protein [Corynebacterium pilosum]|uniref:hypothetical protein n=1 Tax=Corynebacterium pilosum TaxID=35756 RepID=UPI0011C06E72|nr:hypothetical protein [Corynebacterium pilosum]